jgi:hypothetical protein
MEFIFDLVEKMEVWLKYKYDKNNRDFTRMLMFSDFLEWEMFSQR